MNKNFDTTKILGMVGTVLAVASTLISGYAGNKNMEELIEEKVQEALRNK